MKATTKTLAMHDTHVTQRALLTAFTAMAVYLLLIAPAFASGTTIGGVLCAVADLIHDDVGHGLATLGVLSVGVGATLGKVSWTMAITVACGIGVLFGASAISVDLVGSGC